MQGPFNEDVTSDEVLLILDLFYSPPSQPVVDHGPAWPETAFSILPFDKTMSLPLEAMLSVRVTPFAQSLMVISMQPQYEDDKEDWLLEIPLNDEKDDEVED
ncbi:hypothetical protein L226DRAFT_522070 [Lentinus tigrinus ALCF2SS1-7]|uniref:Uncharacterized protein n=1 Tax=Lentinus tigrinus ALCF2SS1-6 TaxID=1328759 RepID=A0A5C2SKX5_9APHY|nr:hypothetical protein L227DRAFT_560989 [Lentinus tigrinus ALCF2SS1-6]RPD76489.1 hypothetical protein L226DRAFT_522070 [Lentinus tigrinus ALCF2SS1-7]